LAATELGDRVVGVDAGRDGNLLLPYYFELGKPQKQSLYAVPFFEGNRHLIVRP